MVRQTSKWGQIFLLSLIGLGATAFATAWIYRLDEIITVQGRLVPQRGGVEVKSPISGQLIKILIKNGEQVKKGQALLKFDVRSATAEKTLLKDKLVIEKQRFTNQLASNTKQQETLRRNIALTERILQKLQPLESGGAISEIQILQQKNQLETQKDQLLLRITARDGIINDSNTRKAELEGALKQVINTLRNEVVTAPISGTVFDLKPDNDRYVAVNAEPLMKIVPYGQLGGEVNIDNRDIGFIRKGQEVKVRVDSFPYTEYGEIIGSISRIGADALPPDKLIRNFHFPIDLKLNRSTLTTRDGMIIPLQAGMTITTNLKLRDRRLIELLSDLFANRSDSLKRLRQP